MKTIKNPCLHTSDKMVGQSKYTYVEFTAQWLIVAYFPNKICDNPHVIHKV